jgi:NTE family protein
MALKIGLALSGGGSKGAFTVGVLKAVDQILDPGPFRAISGTSTGALVGTLIATNQFARLVDIYSRAQTTNIVNPHYAMLASVAGPESVLFAAAILGGRAIYDTSALRATIECQGNFDLLRRRAATTLMIYNTVSLQTGKLETFNNRDHTAEQLVDALLASASMPVLMDPVEMKLGATVHQLVDGGVREFLPLRALFDAEVALDHIIAISTSPLRAKPRMRREDDIVQILGRTIDLLNSEIGRDDYDGALLFNAILQMIENAEEAGVSRTRLLRGIPAELRRRFGDKRAIPISYIGPDRHIEMDSLTFEPKEMKKVMRAGVEVGKKAVRRIAEALVETA